MNYSDVSARINFALQDLGVQLSFQDVMTRTIPYIFKKPNRADPFLELYSSVMPVVNSYRNFLSLFEANAFDSSVTESTEPLDESIYEDVVIKYARRVNNFKERCFQGVSTNLSGFLNKVKEAGKLANARYGCLPSDIEKLDSIIHNLSPAAILRASVILECAAQKRPTNLTQITKVINVLVNNHDVIMGVETSMKTYLLQEIGFKETLLFLCERVLTEEGQPLYPDDNTIITV